MTAPLEVRFGAITVGALRVDDEGRFAFAYEPSWCTRDTRFPVSLTLPIAAREYVGGPAHTFFSNLLPEGAFRQAICARLGISPDNDFGLLQAIGGECAGALSLADPAEPPADPDDFRYEELQPKRLRTLIADGAIPLLVSGSSSGRRSISSSETPTVTQRTCRSSMQTMA